MSPRTLGVSDRDASPTLRLDRGVPAALLPQVRPLLQVARNLGIGVSGTRGIGKSQLLRAIAWLDLVFHEVPSVVIDPIGATIDGILGHVAHFHRDDQAALWDRIRYVNLTPRDTAVPLPLYYRTGVGRETAYTVAQRLPDALGKFDPKLREASVQGFNSLYELATHLGAVLVALGCQPSEIEAWLRDPTAWSGRLREAAARMPEVRASVVWLEEQFLTLTPAGQRERSRALLNKLVLLADPATRAQFCAGSSGIDWGRVMARKELVLLDLRNETDWETRRFKLLWLFSMITDFARRWGASRSGDRSAPLALMIDEVSFMFSRASGARSPLVDDLDALINQQSRNYNLWLTIAWQELYQLPQGMKQTLMSLGTQFWGRMTDPESMREAADRITVYDPYLQKKVENVYATLLGVPTVIDERTHEFSFAEQKELNRLRFATLPRFTYLVSRTAREGHPPLSPERFSIAPLAARHRPPPELLTEARDRLTRRDGQPVDQILTEIAGRLPGKSPTPQPPIAAAAPTAVDAPGSPTAPAVASPPPGESDVPSRPPPRRMVRETPAWHGDAPPLRRKVRLKVELASGPGVRANDPITPRR